MSVAKGLMQQVSEKWIRLGNSGRWLVVGLAVALVAAVSLGSYLNRPDWVVLVDKAEPRDAAAVVARLQELKVPYRPTGDGYTIMVPKAEQYTAKLALAQAGLPRGGSVGMELFNEPKFGATDFERRVNYLRAQQGELERALMRIDEVEYANVKLAIPERSVFVREQQQVSAAVLVQPRAGRRLTADQVSGIVNFISASVQGLLPAQVKVVDHSGRLLSNGTELQISQEIENEKLQREAEMQREVEHRVQGLLEPIFGAGNVVARVNLELNMDATRIETSTVGNSTPKTVETVRESAVGSNGTSTAPPGGDEAELPPIYQGQAPATGSDLWKTRTVTDYEVSQRKEVTLIAPGTVKRLSVGIAINRVDLTSPQIKQIQETVAGATGANVDSISVAAMLFNRELLPELGANPQRFQVNYLGIFMAGIALLMLIGFLVLRYRKRLQVDAEESPWPEVVAASPTVGSQLDAALGKGSLKAAHGQDGVASAKEESAASSVQERLERVMSAKPKRQMVIGPKQVDTALLSEVNELIEMSPEAGAELLRQWLKEGA